VLGPAAAVVMTASLLAADAPPAPRSFVEDDGAVDRALAAELERSIKELKLGDASGPYFVAYALSDVEQVNVSATFGAATAAHALRARMVRTDVRVGDPSFDNGNFADSLFGGGRVEALPVDDDYATLRRELWLRTDEAYKEAVETLAKKRAAAAGQASREEDDDIPDFSGDTPAKLVIPFPAAAPETAQLLGTVTHLSAVLKQYPEIYGCRVTGVYSVVRRRFLSSEGGKSDERRGTVRIDAAAETQAGDGMRLTSFVPFTALTPSGLPPLAEMEAAVHRMAKELVAMRAAPVAPSGTASVLFEGLAATQLIKILLADHLSGTPAPRTAGGGEERGQTSELAGKLGQKVASPLLMVTDDPLASVGPGKVPLYGSYRVDDEGIAAERVPLIQEGILRGLLMTRTPRQEIRRSNGHARATRFGAPHAAIGNLFVSAKPRTPRGALSRPALLGEMRKAAKGGGLGSYVVRLLEEPNVPGTAEPDESLAMFSVMGSGRAAPPVKPLVVYRLRSDGKEELVRGLTLEGLVPRSLKDVSALGSDAVVHNFHDGGAGFTGIPSTIVTPSLLLSDVEVRRTVGRNKRPPLYPRPAF
jgi:predicted Zn-dependent protease